MHPILFVIPATWWMLALVAVAFGVGGVIRTRFAPAPRESSYLASFLGLNVRLDAPAADWGTSLRAGVVQAAVAAGVAYLFGKVAGDMSARYDGIPLHLYGVLMASAFIVGLALSSRQAVREGLPPVPLVDGNGIPIKDSEGNPQVVPASEILSDLAFYLLISGLLGSRLMYIATRWDAEYAVNPAKALRIWEGGLVWYGGFILASLVAYVFVRRYRVSFWPYADVLVPTVAIGHAIGRLGCFAAGCCFGDVAASGSHFAVQFPRDSPAWHAHVSDGLIRAGEALSLPVYPTQLLEAGGETLIFLALTWLRPHKRFHGQLVLAYLFLYPLLRVVIEMFRGDKIRGFWFKWPDADHPLLLSTSQGVSIAVALVGLVTMIVIQRQHSKTKTG